MQKTGAQKSVEALNGNKFDFDEWYAEAWSRKQGGFSTHLANSFINYIKERRKNIKSVLDVCSGSGEFISILRNITVDCVGVDNADGYLNYARRKHSDVEFVKVEQLHEFKLRRKFDLVSCNRDVVNMFTNFEKWKTFFKTAYDHLNNGGLFMFDFYTEKKLSGWSEVIFEQSDDLDYVSKVSQNNGLCVMNDVYYIKESSVYYRKSADIMVETWFKTEDIVKALQTIGFKNIKFIDIEFNEIPLEQLNEKTRLHILAEK